jgi:hypothetical protein
LGVKQIRKEIEYMFKINLRWNSFKNVFVEWYNPNSVELILAEENYYNKITNSRFLGKIDQYPDL